MNTFVLILTRTSLIEVNFPFHFKVLDIKCIILRIINILGNLGLRFLGNLGLRFFRNINLSIYLIYMFFFCFNIFLQFSLIVLSSFLFSGYYFSNLQWITAYLWCLLRIFDIKGRNTYHSTLIVIFHYLKRGYSTETFITDIFFFFLSFF